jgi:hypothetical protein
MKKMSRDKPIRVIMTICGNNTRKFPEKLSLAPIS